MNVNMTDLCQDAWEAACKWKSRAGILFRALLFEERLRAGLNFLQKVSLQLPPKSLSGLFSSFYSSHSPLCS
ncbi:hypothetical protein, partial [uncultured Bacteroides sp.]|uniref:hypothetical protein n=1 Tax=uncultured Bacteroides sp. TaxID=162156 RepID=UPI00263052AD